MTSGDDKGGRSRRRPASQRSGNRPSATGGDQNAKGAGCAATFVVALVVLPILWGLYDEGVFSGRDEAAESAPFFGPKRVGRLVQQLSTAADAQGVCYGWVIDSGRSRQIKQVTPSYPGTFRPKPPGTPAPAPGVPVGAPISPAPRPEPTGTRPPAPVPTSTSTRGSYTQEEIASDLEDLDDPGMEYGSNLGPGQDPRQAPARCPKWVVLVGDYNYSRSYQEYTFGRLEIKTSFDDLDTIGFERRLGQSGEDDIDGEYGVARLRDAIGALPMLVAEEGLAPPVPARTSPVPEPPAGDEISKSTFTKRTIWTGIGIALIAGGVVWVTVAGVRQLRRNRS